MPTRRLTYYYRKRKYGGATYRRTKKSRKVRTRKRRYTGRIIRRRSARTKRKIFSRFIHRKVENFFYRSPNYAFPGSPLPSGTNSTRWNLSCSAKAIINWDTQQMITSYKGIYDQVRVKSITWTFFLKSSENYSDTSNDNVVKMVHAYDPDGQGKALENDQSYYLYPGSTTKAMKPFKAYKLKLWPTMTRAINTVFSVNTNITGTPMRFPWMDFADLQETLNGGATISSNCYHVLFDNLPDGSQNYIQWFASVHLQFKNKRNRIGYEP